MKSLLTLPRVFVAFVVLAIVGGCFPVGSASASTVDIHPTFTDEHTSVSITPGCLDGLVTLEVVVINNDPATPDNLMQVDAYDGQTHHGLSSGSLGPVAGQTPAFGHILTLSSTTYDGVVTISRIYLDGHLALDPILLEYPGTDCTTPSPAPLQVSAAVSSRCLPRLGLYSVSWTVTNLSDVPVRLTNISLGGIVFRPIGAGESVNRHSYVSGHTVRSAFRVLAKARDGRELRVVSRINPPLEGNCYKVRN